MPIARTTPVATTCRRLALVVPLALGACRGAAGTLATVGDRSIRMADLAAVVEVQTGSPLAEAPPELVAALFENLLEEEVVLAASGQPADTELAPAARSALVREALQRLCPPPPLPTAAEVDAFLAASSAGEPAGERLRLRQLLLPDQAAARAARDRLRRGEEFAEVSRQMSRAPNAAEGGLLGWVGQGQLPPEFEAAVFALPNGGISEPVASTAGWHIFQVIERRAAGSADPSRRERARAELAAQKAEASRRACLSVLAARVGVTTPCKDATFPCRNPFEA
ncbi:MAG TPA: peptidylprolyl isomerase [Thermoanaerobaculaceae bacterium]|nr:peptidylprolyl isomerase [Thermoanaerobaculaceae bacterium]HRS16354.1 peptidylprolyl isomerase [Thermoanaerobaculaceae bacterium]